MNNIIKKNNKSIPIDPSINYPNNPDNQDGYETDVKLALFELIYQSAKERNKQQKLDDKAILKEQDLLLKKLREVLSVKLKDNVKISAKEKPSNPKSEAKENSEKLEKKASFNKDDKDQKVVFGPHTDRAVNELVGHQIIQNIKK